MSTAPRSTALVIALLLSACSTGTDGNEPSPLPETVELDCALTGNLPPAGVVGLSDPNTLDQGVIDLIGDARAGWARAEFHWSLIEPEVGGTYDFAAYDAMMDGFEARDIQVLGILTYLPPGYGHDWELIEQGFRAFATATVGRYAARGVHTWEVFNEPNLTGYGWLSDDDEAFLNLPHYVRLLGIANEVIREVDPEGVVVLGGVASEQHRGLALEQTMEIIYGYDAHDCFDVFAFHPYGYQNDFPAARARIDAVLDSEGEGDKPVWFTEYGWTDHQAMDLAVNNTVETNPMMAAFSQKDVADAFFWFSAKDYSSQPGTPTFGLADYNLNRRPSFATFQGLIDGSLP